MAFTQDVTGFIEYNLTRNNCKEQKRRKGFEKLARTKLFTTLLCLPFLHFTRSQ